MTEEKAVSIAAKVQNAFRCLETFYARIRNVRVMQNVLNNFVFPNNTIDEVVQALVALRQALTCLREETNNELSGWIVTFTPRE